MIRTATALALFLVAVTVLLVGCNKPSGPKPKIAIITSDASPFWNTYETGAKDAAKKFFADVEILKPNGDPIAEQKRLVGDALGRDLGGIAICPVDSNAQLPLINDAASRAKIVTTVTDSPNSRRACFVGTSSYVEGQMVGEIVKVVSGHSSQVVIFINSTDKENERQRREGLIDELIDRKEDPARFTPIDEQFKPVGQNRFFNVKYTYVDGADAAKTKLNVETALKEFRDDPSLPLILVGLSPNSAGVCAEVLSKSERKGKVQIVGFGQSDETIQAIKDGLCFATVTQDPYAFGFETVRVLAAMVRGDDSVIPQNGSVDVPARKVRKENLDQFLADLKKQTGK